MTVRDQQIVTSAFDQASEAMMITDAAERVVRINRQFTQLTGFDPSEIIGQTPAILRSGKNDPGFFNEFWNSLNNDGQWRGEIWNRKKNGRLFMADLTVSAIVNHYQKVTYYLAIYRDITQVREDERKREMQEKREPQTFLLTRTAFFHHLADLCAQPPPPDSCPALLLLNLDRFREVNDLNGVAIADEILHETAHRLRKCLRDSDVIGRLNGDEFGVLLPELKAADDMNKVGEKILARIAAPFEIGEMGSAAPLTCSIGLAPLTSGEGAAELALRRANQALRSARQSGGGHYRIAPETALAAPSA